MNENKLKARWAEQDDLEIDTAIGALFQHQHGRRFLWWLLEIGRVGGQPFTQNSLLTAFNCGELNVGQRILDRLLTVSPDGYVSLMKEMNNERNDRDKQLRGDADAGAHSDFFDRGDN